MSGWGGPKSKNKKKGPHVRRKAERKIRKKRKTKTKPPKNKTKTTENNDPMGELQILMVP